MIIITIVIIVMQVFLMYNHIIDKGLFAHFHNSRFQIQNVTNLNSVKQPTI